MSAQLASIWRHPLKAIGREELAEVRLTEGEWLPGDRVWAVAHENARIETSGWVPKVNFLRGVAEPGLMAVTATLKEGRLILEHPDAGSVEADPDDPADAPRLLHWVGLLWPEDKPRPARIVRAADARLTDVPDPWISIASNSSLDAVAGAVGAPVSPFRFRANLWLDGLAPWEEKDWPGRRLRCGGTVLEVRQEITRCKATHACPETGTRDIDMLGVLRTFGHQEFGVYAEVVEGGTIQRGDSVELLW